MQITPIITSTIHSMEIMFGLRESLLTQGAVEFKMCCIVCNEAFHIHASTETWVSCSYHDKTT